ncbi:hypothetical protein H312_03274 [Anncaliia algerae PRA339]|uniref:Uncharacterized protein n=1 Tax=Anncaliia algerae PRA339 TaxID=1288291 RepID=A0A059EX56_9MICR|nr:hypothetical protein H312_03274 [Anncaliia algerae PRA339]
MEEDIKILKKYKTLNSMTTKLALKESMKTKKISYIPYLIETTYDLPDLETYSTTEILHFINILFKNPQEFQKEIKNIGHLLVKRRDLFYCFIKFVENKSFKDDSYYWYPDLEYTDIFSFICSLFEDVGQCLLNYLSKEIIIKREINQKILKNFMNKINANISFQISIMEKDLEYLNLTQAFVPKTNIPFNNEIVFSKTIISHIYWADCNCVPFDVFYIELPSDKDKVFFLCSCFSLVEVEFGNINKVTLLVTLKMFEGLLIKNDNVKHYWMRLGIIDKNWNCIIK